MEGERAFPEDAAVDEEVEPELNMAELNNVIQMGIPEGHAKHALWRTGNSSADLAVSWYFENMADPVLNTPLRVKKEGKKPKDDVDPEKLAMIEMMGFDVKKGRKGLKKCVRHI